MKNIVLAFIAVSSLTIASCGIKDSTQNGKKFFSYDEIEYYYNNFDEKKVTDLFDNQKRSRLDSIKTGVIAGDIPDNISDNHFISHLTKIGYTKHRIKASLFPEFDRIFRETKTEEHPITTCVYVYRDIFIFKKNNKVVGVAKVCFGCLANQIVGTTANTENFGQNGDYNKLEKILNRNFKR